MGFQSVFCTVETQTQMLKPAGTDNFKPVSKTDDFVLN